MKKILRAFVCCLLAVSLLPTAIFAESDDAPTSFEKNKKLIQGLGADISSMANEDALISRGEFISYVISMFGEDISNVAYGNYFLDVSEGSAYAKSINAAVMLGIVDCDSDRFFRPDDKVTYNEAMKITVAALGYNVVAKKRGGYFEGYLKLASETGLTDNVRATDGKMSCKAAFSLIYNMLCAKIVRASGDETIEYSEGGTFLFERRGIECVKGKITANDMSGLYDENAVAYESVTIGGADYGVGESGAELLLGYDVEAYVLKADSEIICCLKSGNDDITEISGSDINEYRNEALYYDVGEKEKSIKLSPDTPIILNMIYSGDIRNSDLNAYMSDSYNVKIIKDKNGNSAVFITKYNTIVVDAVNPADRVILGKYGKGRYEIDDAAEVHISMLNDEGTSYDLDYISEWTVLEIMDIKTASGDEKIYIVIVDYPVKGILTGTSERDGRTYYSIDGTEYEVANSLLQSGEKLPELGKKAIFLSDSLGRFVGVDCDVTPDYGYMFAAYFDTDDEHSYVRIYTKKGEHITVRCNEKVKLNNVSGLSEKQFIEMLKNGDEKVKSQLVTYDINGNGLLTELETAEDKLSDASYAGYDNDNFTLDAKLDTAAYVFRGFYIRQSSTVKKAYTVSDDTMFFDIPKELYDFKSYNIGARTDYTTGSSLPKDAKLYDRDELGNAAVVLIERADATVTAVGEADKTGIIKSISKCVDDDNELFYSFEFYGRADGESVMASCEDLKYYDTKDFGYGTVGVDELREGDLIQYSTDYRGEMLSYRVMFRPSDPDSLIQSTSLWDGIRVAYGNVVAVSGDETNRYFSMLLDGKLTSFNYRYSLAKNYNADAVNIYIYDSAKKEVKLSKANEITKGDNVFIRVYYGIGQLVMIVR